MAKRVNEKCSCADVSTVLNRLVSTSCRAIIFNAIDWKMEERAGENLLTEMKRWRFVVRLHVDSDYCLFIMRRMHRFIAAVKFFRKLIICDRRNEIVRGNFALAHASADLNRILRVTWTRCVCVFSGSMAVARHTVYWPR